MGGAGRRAFFFAFSGRINSKMKRPSFQFYPGDWTGNSKLRMCKAAHKGAWVDVLCLMHDADEYGVIRSTLADIAQAVGHPVKLLRDLSERGILKGSDTAVEPFIFTPRHAGKDGKPVTLIAAQQGPLWYSSRFVRDEYVRLKRGEGTRFGDSPTHREGDGFGAPFGKTPTRPPTHREGHGPSSSTSSSTSIKASAYSDARALFEKHKVNIDDTWLGIWSAYSLERMEKAIAIARGRLKGKEVRATYLDPILNDDNNFKESTGNGYEKPWFIHSSTAIEAKGAELGLKPERDEQFPYFKDRVFKAAGITEDMVRKAEAEYRK